MPAFPAFRPLLLALALGAADARAASVLIGSPGCDADAVLADGFEDAGCDYAPDASGGTGGDATAGDHDDAVYVPEQGVTRSFAYRVPAGYDPAVPAPLLVALHGTASNVASAAATMRANWASTADAAGAIVLTPFGTGSGGGWNGRDAATIAAALARLESRYNVDRRRRHLWGYSAGGHFGHAVVLDDPAPWASYGVSAGALRQYACDAPGAPSCAALLGAANAANRVPVSIFVGTSDPLQPWAAGDPARFRNAGWPDDEVRYVEFAGGHTYYLLQLPDIWAWLARYARAR